MTDTMPTEADQQRIVDGLKRELAEARAERAATAEILEVINSSPADLAPVFDAILRNAHALCGVAHGSLQILDDGNIRAVAVHGLAESLADILRRPRPVAEAPTFQTLLQGRRYSQVDDVRESDNPILQRTAQLQGARTLLSVPLRREGKLLGMIVCARREAKPFTEREISLLESFAAQAVLAIQNARLFNETKEALERQTATAEILEVINSSPANLTPVFDAILRKAHELCGIAHGSLQLWDGECIYAVAVHGMSEQFFNIQHQRRPITETPAVQALLRGERYFQIDDARESAFAAPRRSADIDGTRTILGVPLRKDGRLLGVIFTTRREVKPFSEKEISLLESFAAQAAIAIENARLLNEVQAKTRDLEEAFTYQTGSSNILRVIASSPTDVKPVLQAIVESACELCGAYDAVVRLKAGNGLAFGAHHGPLQVSLDSLPFTENSTAGRAIMERQPVHVHDLLSPDGDRFPQAQALSRSHGGERTILSVPLLREGEGIGAIILRRTEMHPFSDKQIALLQTFADQAVIALGNVRLFEEVQAKTHDLEEALRYQTGSANILNVIASSPTDVKPVLKAIVESACELCEANDAVVLLKDGDNLCFSAHHGPIPVNTERWPISRGWASGRAVVDRATVHVHDIYADEDYAAGRELSRRAGSTSVRSILAAPLLREGESIGAILLRRQEVRPFNDKQIALLQTFADQAVIALGNVRLFEEVQAKTRDIEEALRYQTGSANILNVIASSPTDVQPVLKAIVESACKLCEAYDAVVLLNEGDHLLSSAHHGPIPMQVRKRLISRKWTAGRAFIDRKAVHVHDLQAEQGEFPDGVEMAIAGGYHSIVSVPLLREGESIGALTLRRTELHPFSDKQIALLETFADQAVIALGNVRLFEEVQARTRDLQESLQQQTATADVLKVISRSAFDLQAVLDTLVTSAAQLCGADGGIIWLRKAELFHAAAAIGFSPQQVAFFRANPRSIHDKSLAPRVLRSRRTVHIPDRSLDPEFAFPGSPGMPSSMLGVPLLREDRIEGVFTLTRTKVAPFTPRQMELVELFADQAVIAIENVRLFDEVQARTRDLQESLQQQTATADVLKVISRSAFDLQAVLQALVESAAKLSDSDKATITRQRDGVFYRAETYGFSDQFMEYARSVPIVPDRSSATSRALLEARVVHIPDVAADADYTFREGQRLGDFRAVLAVPMLRERTPIGVIVLTRTQPQAYTQKQIELVTTFADQAAIAIENVRLFESVQARTRELAESLDDLRTAQDRLVQTEKLASLGQLTAGIAHEIKNPLNFVNNFAALSVELTDELNDVLKQASLADKLRAEADELTGLLKDNLAKVVQHGKRADSIVKNMLLHSREGSGEHRPADINALVDESLNLAYHGARAEKPQFNVTLQRNFDPEAGMVDVFPQEITRVFLNLLSNGFYAVTKRKADNSSGFEPVVSAMTKGRADGVEIRIRDNGTGVPPEVKEKMFNPFFTTKPAGEGTGLGLSMSYDIIVKQHGGTIDVETLPGEFTEFTIVLPRTSLSKKN